MVPRQNNSVAKKIDKQQIIEEINSLSAMIEEAKKNEANLSGRIQEAMRRLKEEFKLSSFEEAEKELTKLESEIAGLFSSVQKKFAELKENYSW